MKASRRELAQNLGRLLAGSLGMCLIILIPAQIGFWLAAYYYQNGAHTTWVLGFVVGWASALIGVHTLYGYSSEYFVRYLRRAFDYFDTIHYPRGDDS